ncbi:MAG: hypothetical protein EPN23_10850 [Verrucomicrobia bacterium]|nr:MAG: hypothetical protein EPN23_10850 [Verrucomicrobiota bacterium]
MNKTKIILGVLVVFLLGMAAGSLLTFRFVAHRFRQALHGPIQPGAEFIVQHLTHRLDLDVAQQKLVRVIVEDTRRQFERLRVQTIAPESERILRESDQQMKKLLRPEQQKKYRLLVAERHPPLAAGAPPRGLPPDRPPAFPPR